MVTAPLPNSPHLPVGYTPATRIPPPGAWRDNWKGMMMKTSARDYALLSEIADYMDVMASDAGAFAARGLDKKANLQRAKWCREVSEEIREIEIIGVHRDDR